MAKFDPSVTEYTPNPDHGTYQTGSTHPPKRYRGIIALLMIVVTCLGGLASALGIINIHLLLELEQQTESLPVSIHTDKHHLSTTPSQADVQAPSVPQRSEWHMDLLPPITTQEHSPASIINKCLSSTVTVICQYASGCSAEQTGVVVNEAGFLVTNYHSLIDAESITVHLSDSRTIPAALVGGDGYTDLAVLYVEATGLIPAHFADSDALIPGDYLVAFQNSQTITEGLLLDSAQDFPVGTGVVSLLSTELGSVNGPVYNNSGQIVAFGSEFWSDCCPDSQSTWVLSNTTVKAVVEQIIAGGQVSGRPDSGILLEKVQQLHQCYWNLPDGLRIKEVTQDNAVQMGLVIGDILTEIEGQPISDWSSYYCAMWRLTPGQTVQITVMREGNPIQLQLTVTETGI